MTKPTNSTYQIRTPLVLSIGLVIGFVFGSTNYPKGGGERKNENKLSEVLSFINTEYVNDVDEDILVDETIQHMLTKLDPHSVYIPAQEKVAINEELQGNFEGIGIEFNIFHDTLAVITPLSGGPAERIGLLSGDQIIEIDDENVAGIKLTNRGVAKRLKGPKGTQVTVKVFRRRAQKQIIFFTITRDKIPQYSVNASYMLDAKTGYIKINRFSQTTYDEFQQAMDSLINKKMIRLILDLQGNPGGYMDPAVRIVDDFLSADKKIVYTEGKNERYKSDALSSSSSRFEQGNLVVLINEGSSSASEIVAGALQDNDRALIVGRRSYGKGLVQSLFELSDGSEMRLTVSRYYTPSGRCIQKPYDDEDNYASDITNRFSRGELFSADSIQFNDSLKYKTSSGRTVYGGGGIMPDVFVPLDTTRNNKQINRLINSNSLQEYAFQYSLTHRKKLEKMGVKKFSNHFSVSDTMVLTLLEIARTNDVTIAYTDFSFKGIEELKTILKANIARRLWNDEGFYPIINKTNNALQQAILSMDEHSPNLLIPK